jgi:TolB-like protein/Flp pilus assembly protein TadD
MRCVGGRSIRTIAHALTLYPGGASTPAAHQPNLSNLLGPGAVHLRKFLRELKERGVYQVAAVYSAGAWALLQVADVIFPLLGLDEHWISGVLIVAALGFPLALLLAWALDWTPQGVEITEPLRPAASVSAAPLRPAEWLILLLLAALILLVGLLYWDRLGGAGDSLAADAAVSPRNIPAHNTIAVLPFTQTSGGASDDYLGDGLAEEIINLLVGQGNLQVAARTSSFAFRDRSRELDTIAQTLGVRHLLDGNVRRDGDAMRVSVQLVDASSGFTAWSATYDRSFEDIFTVRNDIATQVMRALQGGETGDMRVTVQQRATSSLEAYEHYLRALNYLQRPEDAESLGGAISLLQRAVDLDPAFVEARAATCRARLGLYSLQRSVDDYNAAERSCFRALALAPAHPDVSTALGELYLETGEYERSGIQFGKVIAEVPDHVDAHIGLARVRFEEGKTAESEALMRTLLQRWPYHWPLYKALGELLFRTGHAEEAVQAYRKVVELTPDNHVGYNGIGTASFMLGDYATAVDAWTRSLELAPTALTYGNTGTSYFYLQQFDRAAAMYRKAVGLAPEDFELHGALGDALYWGDEPARARESYRRAAELAQQALRINPGDADTLALLAHYQAGLAEEERARESARRAMELAPDDMFVCYDLAVAFALLGDEEGAGRSIERAIELGYPAGLALLEPGLKGVTKALQAPDSGTGERRDVP